MADAAASSAGGKVKTSRRKQLTKNGISRGYSEKIPMGPMDLPFFFIIMVLLVMGIIMMFSAGYAWAIKEQDDGTYYVRHQLFMAGIGLAGMLAVSYIDYHVYRKPIIVYGSYVVSAILMILCKFGPFADPQNNAYRWVKIGPIPSFQPSELMKLAIILIFAYIISANYSKLETWKYGIFPFVGFLGGVVVLMLVQRHVSGTIIICVIGLAMMFVGGCSWKKLVFMGIIGAVLLVLGVLLMIKINGFTYVENRIITWRDPFNEEALDTTWQTRNSLIAIGSGGVFGLGLGNSRQKFLYLPQSKNDFVFAIVCEELGLVGALMVIIIFLLFIIRGFYISTKAPDKFGMMVAVGLTFQIGLQALLNIAVVTNSIPNTGVSLPFFSYGGTALIMQLVQMGIILNISRQSIMKT